jgi:hypothetical protein
MDVTRDPSSFADGAPPPPELVARLAPFFPGFDLGRLRLHRGTPRFVPRRFRAYTSGCRVFLGAGRCDPASDDDTVLLAHEAAHAAQYERLGAWRFRWRYLLEYARGRLRGLSRDAAYRAISFEREARALERRVRAALRAG